MAESSLKIGLISQAQLRRSASRQAREADQPPLGGLLNCSWAVARDRRSVRARLAWFYLRPQRFQERTHFRLAWRTPQVRRCLCLIAAAAALISTNEWRRGAC